MPQPFQLSDQRILQKKTTTVPLKRPTKKGGEQTHFDVQSFDVWRMHELSWNKFRKSPNWTSPRDIRFQIPSFQTNFHGQLLHPLLRPHHGIDDFRSRDGFHRALLALGHRRNRADPEPGRKLPGSSRRMRHGFSLSILRASKWS